MQRAMILTLSYMACVGSALAGGPTKAMEEPVLVQGGALRTWSFSSPSVEQVQVDLSTHGRLLNANIELWHGPDNIPYKIHTRMGNGNLRPFSAVVDTPGNPNTVAVRNIAEVEFPLAAKVSADNVDQ